MRGLFASTGVVLFLVAIPRGLLLMLGGEYILERTISAVGFAVAGGLCYIAAALHEPNDRPPTFTPKQESDAADA